MRFSNAKMTGSILGLLLASAGSAQTYVSEQGNLQIIRSGSQPSNVVMTQNGYNYTISDTSKLPALKPREIIQEIAMPKGGEIYIENRSIALQVKTWDQPKVKLVTIVDVAKESPLTDAECFERIGISLKALGSSVKIKSNSSALGSGFGYSRNFKVSTEPLTVVGYPNQNSARYGSVVRYDNFLKEQKRTLIIYVPSGSKMDIESNYADVQLPTGIGDVLLDITSGNLEAENLNKLRLRSKYSNANVRDIKEAEIEFSNGRFTANNIDDLDIESKYAAIEMASAKKIKMVSTNDEFEVEDAGEISGRKNYGNLRITRLTGSLEMDGSNADIKVRNVGSNVKFIKVDNRYADIRIPLRDTKNYAVDFLGNYSTVYTDFEKKPVDVTEADVAALARNTSSTPLHIATRPANGAIAVTTVPAAPAQNGQLATAGKLNGTYLLNRSGSSTPVKFTGTVGDGKGLKIDMKCQNCTVDFK